MSVDFNHTILSAKDSHASALFLAEMLSLQKPRKWGPFWMVTTDNGANLDYVDIDREIVPPHYAILVDDTSFDAILARLQERNLPYWADRGRRSQGQNRHD